MLVGNDFQCIEGPNDRLGNVYKIIDVEPNRSGVLFALLNDSTRVLIDKINSDYFMITEQTPRMPPQNIRDSKIIPKISEAGSAMPELAQLATVTPTQVQPTAVQTDIIRPEYNIPVQAAQPVQASAPSVDIFGMFASSKLNFQLQMDIILPPLSLLQTMYSQSIDKEDFMNKLASYIYSNITMDTIKAAAIKKLTKSKKKDVEEA